MVDLTRLYELQKKFMESRGIDFSDKWMTRERRVALGKEYLLRLVVELGEVFEEGQFKYPEIELNEAEVDAFEEELVDSLMYLMQLFILFDVSPCRIEKIYRAKMKVVKERAKKWVKPKILT